MTAGPRSLLVAVLGHRALRHPPAPGSARPPSPPIRIGLVLALLAGLLVAGPTAVAAAGAAAPAPTPTVALAPCVDVAVPADCGSIDVPLDRSQPSSGTTTVSFALLRRLDPSRPSQGTIAYDPGGPGAASIAQAGDLAARFAPLRQDHDLLLIDPRGTGRSDALECPLLEPSLVFAPASAANAAVGGCGRQLGVRRDAYGSAAVADDFDDVRAALGVDRLDLWGESYGTYLMTVYAARHPQHVRSIVLSGAYPIDFDPWGRDRAAALRQAIRNVCDRSAGRCQGSRLLAAIQTLAGRLRQHPVPFTIDAGAASFASTLDEDGLAATLYGASSDVASYGRVPAAVASALAGDAAPLERLVAKNQLSSAQLLVDDPAIRQYYSPLQTYATACHDYPRVYSYADTVAQRTATYEHARDLLDPRAFLPFSVAAWTRTGIEGVDDCIAWPSDDPAPGRPIPVGTPLPDVPVLVLAGDLDSNTPSSAGRLAAAQFPHGRFVEVRNAGHTPTDGSACGAAIATRFVRTLTVAACGQPPTPAPVVTAPAPLTAATVAPVAGTGTLAQRGALGLVVATSADLDDQADTLDFWGGATGLRGGTYATASDGSITLTGVRVVTDATVSGTLVHGADANVGPLTVSGAVSGQLDVRVTRDGHGRATGTLAGAAVDLTF